jgi:class 3 adenylate cyclase/tetratricopeptide (TPR) repeat protein
LENAAEKTVPFLIPSRRDQPLALVFTDVVGSSAAKRAAELGADASARDRAYLQGIQTRHLRLVRESLAAHSGTEIMTIGDSFFLTFADARDALLCAAEIQTRLAAQAIMTHTGPLKLRIGIHVGTPEFFENSWHGTDVDTAARVESAGSPAQILLSAAARQAVGDMPGITLRPLGTFALKGVGNVSLFDADYDKNGLRIPSATSLETLAHERRMKSVFRIGYAVLAVLLIGGGYFAYRRQHKPVIGEKEPIILADLANKTGDPVFDATITPAITIQLQQSPILNLVSHSHLRQSMKYLGKPADDPITPDLARQIGQREGIKAYLSGEVDKLGSSYVITLNAQNTTTGDTLATEQAQASDKDHVLEAAGEVATKMRSHLGESLSSIKKLDTPFNQATTPSLEAFQAYALGDADHQKGLDVPQAESHYRQAVTLDPNFAMAWARLGVVYNNASQHLRATEAFNKAFALSKNVSERERLYIQGAYYQLALGDYQKARATMELAEQTYPLDLSNRINLGSTQETLGDFDGGVESDRKVLAIEPKTAVASNNLLAALVFLDRLQEAHEVLTQAHQHQVDHGTNYLQWSYLLAYLEGDTTSSARILTQTEGHPDQYLFTQLQAQIDESEGRYRDAAKVWQRAVLQAKAQQEPDTEASFLLNALQDRALAANCAGATKVVSDALALDKSKDTLSSAADAAAFCNLKADADPLLAKLAADYPQDTRIQKIHIPLDRAALALADHQPALALQLLPGQSDLDNVAPIPYFRGLAHLELHDAPSAIADFKIATRWKGNSIENGDYGQGLLGLARAYTLNNDKPNALKTYQSLLTLWQHADPDLPQLLAAKKEYAALQ